jgi:hypothetical protein
MGIRLIKAEKSRKTFHQTLMNCDEFLINFLIINIFDGNYGNFRLEKYDEIL